MSNVVKVEPHPKNPEWRILTTDDQRQFIVFSAKLADGLELGKPLPQGTSEEAPKFDGALPSLRLPRPQGGGGMSAWRNTKEGFEAETRGRQRWQEIEEEKRDRRTALMQAVEALEDRGDQWPSSIVLRTANDFYAWLRSSPAPGDQEAGRSPAEWLQKAAQDAAAKEATKTAPERRQGDPEASQTSPAAGVDGGERGRAAAPQVPGLGSEPAVGDTSSPSSGEASAASVEPGVDDSGEGVPLGSTRFPVKPEDCSHKFGTTGNWLKTVQIEGKPHCPRCGMSALLYRESDVGP